MQSQIDHAIRRTRRYWYEDGIIEIALGCIFLAIGLLFFVDAATPLGPSAAGFSAIGLPIVVIGGSWIARRAVAAAKARLIYPRTGYVAYRRPPRSRRLATGIVAGAIAALVVGLFRAAPASPGWIPLVQGLLIGGGFLLYVAYRLGLTRFHVLALVSVVAGGAAALGGLGDILGSGAYFGAMGVALIVSGALTLRRYLRQTQPLAEA